MIILIDIGNTSVKWALFNNSIKAKNSDEHDLEIYDNNTISYRKNNNDEVIQVLLDSWCELDVRPKRVLISNVGCKELAEDLEEAIWQEYEIEAEFLASSRKYRKLVNSYSKPSQLGVDRWLNLIGAYEFEQDQKNKKGFCVIDSGTAITIDVVDKSWVHLGGFIVPGVNLMQESLLNNTAQIEHNLKSHKKTYSKKIKSEKSPSSNNLLLAHNTEYALKGGIYYCLLAYIERILEDLSSTLNGDYTVYLTGGDADKLYSMLKTDKNEHLSSVLLEPDLIWHGMVSVA